MLPNSKLPSLILHDKPEKHDKSINGASNKSSISSKRTRKIQRGKMNQQGETNSISDRTKLQKAVRGGGPPVDQETDNSNHLSNSAHIQNPNQPVLPTNDPKGDLNKHYRSTMVRITPTGNVTMTLDYVAKCPITHKDATSALARAFTSQCKQEIADIVCREQKEPLYPEKLPRYCPLEGESICVHIGPYS